MASILPVKDNDEDAILTQATRKGSAQDQQTDVASSKIDIANILVIDDEESIRGILADILVYLEHHVTTAAGGMEGIEKFRAGDYDIVFTDLGMPEVSGWEVVRKIKTIEPGVTIVLITGWINELGEDELSTKDIDFVIPKPFRVSEIGEVVSKAMSLKGETSSASQYGSLKPEPVALLKR